MSKILSLALVIFLLASCQAHKEKIFLNLSKNETYTQKTKSSTSVTQTINGQQVNMLVSVNGTMVYKVTDIRDSLYTLEAKYESLSLQMAHSGGVMEFSSDKNDKNDILSTILGMLKDQPFTVKMTTTGRIAEVSRIESLFTNILDQFPQIPDMQKQQVRSQLMQAFGEKAFKGNIEMVTAIFPGTSVSKGSKWTIKTQLESAMAATMETVYELKDITGSYYLITGNATIATADKDAYIQSNGLPLKYNLTGTMVSEIKIDKTSGWIIASTITQDIGGNAEAKDSPQTPEGMVIPMLMKTEMTITR
jgi:hypothetical protein